MAAQRSRSGANAARAGGNRQGPISEDQLQARIASGEIRADTKKNMEKLGFAMGGNVDTFMLQNEKPDWGSQKGTRRAVIAKDYRITLNIGDQLGDFDDRYRASEADRLKTFEESKERWGLEWIVLGNPSYGSFETAPFGHDFKKPREEQRKAKWDVLQSWSGP